MTTPEPATAEEASGRVVAHLRNEISAPVPTAFVAFARHLASLYGARTIAILLYGSSLRSGSPEGLADFYVLVDGYPLNGMLRGDTVAARILPPTVHHRRFVSEGRSMAAKVAVISRRQLERRLAASSFDTSLWARFCQPVALVYARDAKAADDVVQLLTRAVSTAAIWAARLGPRHGPAGAYWEALLRATYSAELRVEAPTRGASIYAWAGPRFDALLEDAWRALGWDVRRDGGHLHNPIAPGRRGGVWRLRRWSGKTLNGLRLIKAAFTFDGGGEYIAGKIQRHTGQTMRLSGFQRRHPVLAAPAVLWWAIRHRLVR